MIMASVVDIEEIGSDVAASSPPHCEPIKVRISSVSFNPSPTQRNPRKTRTRHRQMIFLDEEQCQQLLENLMTNRDLQGKALQIQEFKAQLAHLAEQRVKEENANISESFSAGHMHFESGDFSGSPIVVEPDEVNAEDMVGDIPQDSGYNANTDGLSVQGTYSVEIVPELNRSFTESLVEFVIGRNKDEIVERAESGSHIVRELALGNVAGYVAACFLKKFGKTFLYSIVGGALLLKVAHSKDYIHVNWDVVYDYIQGPMLEGNHGQIHGLIEDFENGSQVNLTPSKIAATKKARVTEWLSKKFATAGTWAKDNSCLAVGFAMGFMFKSVTCKP